MNELLEALETCDEEDREFIQDELLAEIQKQYRNLDADKPQWWRVRWGFEQPRSQEHYMECYKIWCDKLKDGTLYKEFPVESN